MIKHLYFFRHGETNENRDGIRYGLDSGGYLIDSGFKQAQALADYLSNKDLQIIYSSPYERSVDTANIVAEKHNDIKIIIEEDLREGVFYFWHTDDPEKQKSIKETYKRVSKIFNKIINDESVTNIAISSHGGITRALCKLAGKEIGTIKNCECFHFLYSNGNFELVEDIKFEI